MILADLRDCACDRGFRGIVQFDDRQARGRAHQTQQAQGIFQAGGYLLGE
jgi:hypothetical protein